MRFKNVRCNICPNVSHAEITQNYGDFFSGSFYPDPDKSQSGYICGECYSAYLEVKSDYQHFDTDMKDEEFELELDLEDYDGG